MLQRFLPKVRIAGPPPGAAGLMSEDQVQQALATRSEWSETGGAIQRTWAFKNFVEAMAFVNKVGDLAEQAGHHPDIDIRYNKVRLGLVTHDAGGLTAKDFDLAAAVDKAG